MMDLPDLRKVVAECDALRLRRAKSRAWAEALLPALREIMSGRSEPLPYQAVADLLNYVFKERTPRGQQFTRVTIMRLISIDQDHASSKRIDDLRAKVKRFEADLPDHPATKHHRCELDRIVKHQERDAALARKLGLEIRSILFRSLTYS